MTQALGRIAPVENKKEGLDLGNDFINGRGSRTVGIGRCGQHLDDIRFRRLFPTSSSTAPLINGKSLTCNGVVMYDMKIAHLSLYLELGKVEGDKLIRGVDESKRELSSAP